MSSESDQRHTNFHKHHVANFIRVVAEVAEQRDFFSKVGDVSFFQLFLN